MREGAGGGSWDAFSRPGGLYLAKWQLAGGIPGLNRYISNYTCEEFVGFIDHSMLLSLGTPTYG